MIDVGGGEEWGGGGLKGIVEVLASEEEEFEWGNETNEVADELAMVGEDSRKFDWDEWERDGEREIDKRGGEVFEVEAESFSRSMPVQSIRFFFELEGRGGGARREASAADCNLYCKRT